MSLVRSALGLVSLGVACGVAACGSTSSDPVAPAGDAGADARRPPRTGDDDDAEPQVGPMRLSETGLYADFAARELAPDVVQFAPAHPLFSDSEEKERFIQLPAGSQIDTSDMDRWRFPVGTKAWKHFRVGGKLVETRLLWKRGITRGIDEWWHTAYVWEPDGSDALATVEGVPSAAGTNHDVPSQEDCRYCHANSSDVLIGFSAFELSSTETPLSSLASRGWLSAPPTAELVVPGSGNVQETLGYLHGNCGFCHNDDGALTLQSAMRLRLLAANTTPEETGLYTTAINLKMRHVMGADIDRAVVPGEPDKSQLYMRMITLDLARMPPKGPKELDPTGSDAVRTWILGLVE